MITRDHWQDLVWAFHWKAPTLTYPWIQHKHLNRPMFPCKLPTKFSFLCEDNEKKGCASAFLGKCSWHTALFESLCISYTFIFATPTVLVSSRSCNAFFTTLSHVRQIYFHDTEWVTSKFYLKFCNALETKTAATNFDCRANGVGYSLSSTDTRSFFPPHRH